MNFMILSFKHLFSIFGTLNFIHSDRGSQLARDFDSFLAQFDVSHSRTKDSFFLPEALAANRALLYTIYSHESDALLALIYLKYFLPLRSL